MIGRAALTGFGGYPEDSSDGYDHWEFLAKMTLEGVAYDIIPDALVWARPMHGVYRG
eukprot:CAMPEP_0197864038 /NCGR_PEP_ID=MMETSP1438-20131217/41948_1 /TAXON_ID=1461541 /ORGANISM="Pterosperma sp., Strain CCMP1384" /LENGTH=56 /DNA_ID=CAMNT_0043482125 /DNA_START=27 /DNA_END=194 /DNA_ORIENTATION=+